METKHTKGEWYLQEYTDAYTNIVRCNKGKGFETIMIAYTPQEGTEEARANAKIIAAAPELLEACQHALTRLIGLDAVLKADYSEIKELENAIKKATE